MLWQMPTQMNKPLVSIVIPTYNRRSKVLRLLASLEGSSIPKDEMEIIVVDDASPDGTAIAVWNKYPRVKLIRNKTERWLSAARNIGARQAHGKYIFFVDDDNVIAKDSIRKLVDFMESDERVGVAAPMMLYYTDPERIWFAGSRWHHVFAISIWMFADEPSAMAPRTPIPSDDFPNAFIVRASVFRKLGEFDEKNFPIHSSETDFCARVKGARYAMFVLPSARIWHEIPRQFANEIAHRNERYLYMMGKSEILASKKSSTAAKYIIPIAGFFYLFKPLLGVGTHILSAPTGGEIRRLYAYLRGTLDGITTGV
jgi:GT2 family glycosyltransferase